MTQTDSDFSSFGASLKTFRKHQRLTQHQLAKAIGVHRSTLINWEQGNFLPGSKAMTLELAKHLKLNDRETRQLLEASLTALTPHWYVPFSRNPYFTGREEILGVLHTQLGPDQAVALSQSSALYGLGGLGKTQIALEYAYRHALEYSAVFWIGAETEEQVVASLLHIAEAIQLPEREDKDQQRIITAVQRWFSTHSWWLLIWDNLEDLTFIERFLPSTRSGVLLLTTRRQVLGTLARGLDLTPMEQEEGLLFLLRRAKVLDSKATREQLSQLAELKPIQYQAAGALVEAQGGLPLALDQAGAYIEATHCGLVDYLDLFRTQRTILLQQRGEGARDHPASVSTTFTLAIIRATEQHPAVQDLLYVCALLQPDAIPEEIFRQGGKYLGPMLESVGQDQLEWDRMVSVVCAFSLLDRRPEEHTLSMHRLVQAVLLDMMTETEREQKKQQIIISLEHMFSRVEYAPWMLCERLLPHILLCLHQKGDTETTETSTVLASLALKAAVYLRVRGRYIEAEPLYLQALYIREHVLGTEHPDVALTLNNLAILYWEQGKYAEAEPLYLRALRIWEQTMGRDHLQVAYTLENLAILYKSLGKYVEAEALFQRALRIEVQEKGPSDSSIAYPLNNLAALYWEQGKYTEAEALFQQALSIWEQAMGDEHPETARALNNLASVYRVQSKYAEAEALFQRALRIWEQTTGDEHPLMAHTLEDLAELYKDQGKYTEAEPLFYRSLHIREQALGLEHPHTARALNNLAILYREQGHFARSEPLFLRALYIREHHLGQHHPETAETLHDLALLYEKQGNPSKAISLAERAMHIRFQSLGDAHHKTIATQTLYKQLLQELSCNQESAISEYILTEASGQGEKERPVHDSTSLKYDALQAFLGAHCDLHPQAWCRSADLWQAYLQWAEEQQERYPLTRAAFNIQLKMHGCHAGRTKKERTWRGIALVNKHGDGR